ncbi:MAG TPA: hypothetical protein VND43_05260 [Burkholderiales bacterium]|nr:hypothetical protein [Burkholderiales bacterium]
MAIRPHVSRTAEIMDCQKIEKGGNHEQGNDYQPLIKHAGDTVPEPGRFQDHGFFQDKESKEA